MIAIMSIRVRPAIPGDEGILCRLNAFVHTLHVARRPDCFKTTRDDEVISWFRETLSNPSWRTWIAEHDGAPVGYAVAFFHDSGENAFKHASRWCELDQIAIAPEARRQGAARALVDAVLAEAARQGVTRIEMCTWSFNEAALLTFQKLGFQPKVVRLERTPEAT
jgi:ribosomal protein S18 acetylase RimI-like enzyme